MPGTLNALCFHNSTILKEIINPESKFKCTVQIAGTPYMFSVDYVHSSFHLLRSTLMAEDHIHTPPKSCLLYSWHSTDTSINYLNLLTRHWD